MFDIRVAQVIDWAVWALLLPAIYATLDRLPLRRGVWPRHLAGWVAAAFGFGVLHAALAQPFMLLAGSVLRVPPEVLADDSLRWYRLALDDTENFALAVTSYLALQWLHRGRKERARAREVEQSLRQARLHALALELQPHFLFNTLNGIAALMRSDPRTAERMLVRLSDLLRLTLDSGEAGELPLREEVRRLELYLGIQQMRHGDRLTVRVELPDELGEARVPAMLLQPLAENAITHGIGARPGPGTLTVRAWREGSSLCLAVQDDGVGMPPPGARREGLGLGNTRARLGALYPEGHGLAIESPAGGGTSVTVRFPYLSAAVAVAER